jgi:hypothetical protein
MLMGTNKKTQLGAKLVFPRPSNGLAHATEVVFVWDNQICHLTRPSVKATPICAY